MLLLLLWTWCELSWHLQAASIIQWCQLMRLNEEDKERRKERRKDVLGVVLSIPPWEMLRIDLWFMNAVCRLVEILERWDRKVLPLQADVDARGCLNEGDQVRKNISSWIRYAVVKLHWDFSLLGLIASWNSFWIANLGEPWSHLTVVSHLLTTCGSVISSVSATITAIVNRFGLLFSLLFI